LDELIKIILPSAVKKIAYSGKNQYNLKMNLEIEVENGS